MAAAVKKVASARKPPPPAKRPIVWIMKPIPTSGVVWSKDGDPVAEHHGQLPAFFSHVERTADGCWKWTGTLTPNGLPMFGDCPFGYAGRPDARLASRVPTAQRTAYSWWRGVLMPYPGWQMTTECGHKWCVNPAHLRQVRVPKKPPLALHTDTLAAVFGQVEVTRNTGCWHWTGKVSDTKYPLLELGGTMYTVDVLAFRWFGQYGEGQSEASHLLFHQCGVRACINPSHMQLVLRGERRRLASEKPTLPTDTIPTEV